MSKFNRLKAAVGAISPLRSEQRPTGVTFEGAPGYARDAKTELFLLAVHNFVSEASFYEAAAERDARFTALVHQVALSDPDWLTRLVRWLRGDANMRSAAVVVAAEAVRARLAEGVHGNNRGFVDAALQRADEPGEMLGYWMSRYGRQVPKPVKRGVADAAARLYDERSLAKYDSDTSGFRFGDVLELTHPSPRAAWQADLFGFALDRRHDRGVAPSSLPVLRARAELMALPVPDRRAVLDREDAAAVLRGAGMTWEALAGWLQGPMDARAWEVMIPAMGYMALLRNLRNFDEAGVSDATATTVAQRLADPEQVARSRQLPLRFLSAYRAAPSLRWAWALEQALDRSLANVPVLAGRTLVLVDRSSSMTWGRLSRRSGLTYADAAAMFGTVVASRAERADLVQFGTGSSVVPLRRGESVLPVLDRFGDLGGTETAQAVRSHYRGHDRVLILTDEQAWGGRNGEEPTRAVPATVPVYTWNLAGYRHGHGPSGDGNRHLFGGLTDAAFRMVPLLEAGRTATWPF